MIEEAAHLAAGASGERLHNPIDSSGFSRADTGAPFGEGHAAIVNKSLARRPRRHRAAKSVRKAGPTMRRAWAQPES
jgi:hypothetical protein